MTKNPFSLEPIRQKEQFFGRATEVRRVLDFLRHLQCVSIVGPAKTGKTSLLSYVAHPYVRAEHKRARKQVFVFLDGRALADREAGECYLYMQEETIRQVKNTVAVDKTVGVQLERAVREEREETAYFGLRALFRAAERNSLKLVVALDNFDDLADSSCLGGDFFSALRSLHQSYDGMAYLVASRSPLDKLERTRPEASTFFGICQPIELGPFSVKESRELVVTLLRRALVAFPEFITAHILELGSNEPHRLQRAGHVAFQVWQENGGDLKASHCEEISRRFASMTRQFQASRPNKL